MLTTKGCNKCVIKRHKFSDNDGKQHTGFQARNAIRGTAAANEAVNLGGIYSFPAPGVQLLTTAHPDGAGSEMHAQVRARLTQLSSGAGAAADIFLGYTSDNSVVYARVVKNPKTITAGSFTDWFYGTRNNFGTNPAGAFGDYWTCPDGVTSLAASLIASGHNGLSGTGGAPPVGGVGGGGGAFAKGNALTVIPGVKYKIGDISGDVFVNDPFGSTELVYAERGGRDGSAGNEMRGGRASASIGDTTYSGGDAGGAGAANGSGGGGGASTGGNGSNGAGQTAGLVQIAGGDGGLQSFTVGFPGNDSSDPNGSGGGGGGGAGPSGGSAGGLGGTGSAKLEYDAEPESACAHIEFRIRDSRGDYEIPGSNRVPVEFVSDSEWVKIDVCLSQGESNYTGDVWHLTVQVTTGARSYPFSGRATIQGLGFSPGSKMALGAGLGAVDFDDLEFTYYRGTVSHKSCPNCNIGCLIGEGKFTPDTVVDAFGNLGCFWHIESGTAQFQSGYLQIDAGSEVKYLLPHPTNKTSIIANASFVWNDALQVKVDTGNGYAVFDSANKWIKLYNSTGLLLTTSAANLPSHDEAVHFAEVCYESGLLTAKMDGLSVSAASTSTDSVFVNLGSLLGTTSFVSFTLKKHKDEDDPKDSGCDRCETQQNCTECFDGLAPSYYAITIPADITDVFCTPCNLVAGTYIGFPQAPGFCDWVASIPITEICGGGIGTEPMIIVTLTGLVIEINMTIQGNFGVFRIKWKKTYTSKPKCTEFAREEIPYDSSSGGCASGGASAFLTAI